MEALPFTHEGGRRHTQGFGYSWHTQPGCHHAHGHGHQPIHLPGLPPGSALASVVSTCDTACHTGIAYLRSVLVPLYPACESK